MENGLDSYGIIGAIAIIILAIAGICAWPLCCIWAVNTLFGLSISYTFEMWLASLVLNVALTKTVKVNK